jgi:L-rhamnonate dehydratase
MKGSQVLKIKSIEAVRLNTPKHETKTKPRRDGWATTAEVANPMSRYPEVKAHRSMWLPKWEGTWCKVTLEDGTIGYGNTGHGRVTAAIIEDHLAPNLVGENIMANDRLADKLFRLNAPYGASGLASYAVSAIDLAFWDARAKMLDMPVYELAGGPQKDKLFCYATGNDVDWYMELGFKAFKLACPYGPADGLDGLRKNEEFVAKTRELIGDGAELMLDCWMAFDIEYTVRLAETLRPYRLKWIEEYLISDDFDAHLAVRDRLPWQTLATGEHWFTKYPFQWAINHKACDILQPDINWVGGFSTCQTIAGAASAASINVILHGGGNTAHGQHFSYASAAVPWLECFVGTPPGVPLEEGWRLPGQAIPRDGYLVPNDAPGFGLELPNDWFEPFFG